MDAEGAVISHPPGGGRTGAIHMNTITDGRPAGQLAGLAPKRHGRNSGGQAGVQMTHQDKEVCR